MGNNLFDLKTKLNFIKRVLSTIIIIPVIILPIVFGGYVLIVSYLVLFTLIFDELFNIIKNSSVKLYAYLYLLMSIFTCIIFIILLICFNVKELFILIIFLIWIFDTFSYLGGTIIKGKKIFPNVSKGKTYSGLFSGLFGVIVIYILVTNYFDLISPISYYSVIGITILSFIGDSIVSLLKRLASLKDSGNMIPGHGGFLDRFDSFIFVFFFVGLFNYFYI